jgi:hypothetical protein
MRRRTTTASQLRSQRLLASCLQVLVLVPVVLALFLFSATTTTVTESVSHAEAKPFCYLEGDEADDADCYGLMDWDLVDDQEEFYWT